MRNQDLRLLVDRMGDRKQTERTNALKDLSEWLPTNEFRALLDSHTLGARQEADKLAMKVTWP
eukprot:Ihof_evm1s337 gene=Ihof_evmTU1s337